MAETFRDLFCAHEHCPLDKFVERVFWKTLYPHARLFAPLILVLHYPFFEADRCLISSAGDATTMKRVREEVRDYFWDSNNRGWLRRSANLRVSGQRLKDLARDYIPEGVAPPQFPMEGESGRTATNG
jgi:hypothetical protein